MLTLRDIFTAVVVVGVAGAVLSMSACTDKKTARKTLDNAGYSDVEVGGYGFFACGRDDSFSTKFKARNPVGKEVSGVVCNGWFKSGTIRF